jgi:arylsulfatase A-like enzyme
MRTALAILAAVCCLGLSVANVTAADKPNILLIVADDLGWGELGCQGNTEIPTPHTDSIAKNGIRFTSGYVSGPYCSPTRAGLMSGRYQQRFGHEFNPGPTAPDNFGIKQTTIANRLKDAGYATGMFGKWHLGDGDSHPLKRGFDEYYGFLGGAHPYQTIGQGRNAILRGNEPVEKLEFTTLDFGREAAKFIDKNRDKPWFVYLPFNAVHTPMEAPQKYLDRFEKIADKKRRTFAAMLSAMDDAIGEVLGKIREHKLEENTLVIYFADNGGPTAANTSTNGPLNGFKATVWEGGVRVPFLMQWKSKLPAGKVEDRPVIQLDVQPTVLAAAGVAVKPEWKLDGVNLLPYLTSEKKDAPHDALFWRFGRQRAVRQGDWKLTDTGDGAKLFNLAKDIGEKTDLASQEADKLKQLEAAYADWNKGNVEPAWGSPNRGTGKKANPDQPKKKKKKAAA